MNGESRCELDHDWTPKKLNAEEHVDVFFVVCPYISLIFAPKIGMNRTGIVLSGSGCNSSRFSGHCTRSYVKGIQQKRHLHATQKVSFTYNPEAERRGHLLKCYKYWNVEDPVFSGDEIMGFETME